MKIAAFNVKNLGKKKVLDPDVRAYLIKVSSLSSKYGQQSLQDLVLIFIYLHVWLCYLQIVSRYSVVVLLEVVDSSSQAMDFFLEELNKYK